MTFDLHFYANPYDEILLLPNNIFLEMALDGVYFKCIRNVSISCFTFSPGEARDKTNYMRDIPHFKTVTR